MAEETIQLGDKVRCIYTGYEGIVTARTEFINSCVQFNVSSKWDKKSQEVPEISIDQGSLKIISKSQRKDIEVIDNGEDIEEEQEGGAMRKRIKQRGY